MALKFSAEAFRSMEAGAAAAWDREVAAELVALYPGHMRALGVSDDAVAAFVRTVRDYAVAYQVTGKRETVRMAVVALALGAHFAHDPRLAHGVAYALGRTAIPQGRRTGMLGDLAEAWLGATWDGDGLDARGARLVERVRRWGGRWDGDAPARDGAAAALRDLVPQSPTIATPARRAAFLDAVLAQADGYALRAPPARLAYAGGALLHGVYWFDDPLMVRLRGVVEGAGACDDLCARMSAFYARFAAREGEAADGP